LEEKRLAPGSPLAVLGLYGKKETHDVPYARVRLFWVFLFFPMLVSLYSHARHFIATVALPPHQVEPEVLDAAMGALNGLRLLSSSGMALPKTHAVSTKWRHTDHFLDE